MSEFPSRIRICEEGPREGFQIEPGPISTADKIALIDALSTTGLQDIQVCSFVGPRLVPGWADADAVVAGFNPRNGICYRALWFNNKGIERALHYKDRLTLIGTIYLAASEAFSISNLHRNRQINLEKMREQSSAHIEAGIAVTQIILMAAFGCNFAGDIGVEQVLESVQDGLDIASDAGAQITDLSLCDTMGWANPLQVERVLGSVRERWPELQLTLHLHDTRGLGIANAYTGLRMGVARFDTTVGGLGGCPFAKHAGAPGNIATEELALLADELGIDTGIDIDALIDAGHLAERIIGHQLPSAVLRGGSLAAFRSKASR